MKLPQAIVWVVALAATPVLAHHSFAMFDSGRSLTLEGMVTKYQWTNPHGYIGIDAKTGGGEIKHYTLELTSINMLSRAGWTSRSVKSGDEVTAIVAPLRDERAGGLLLELRFKDGRKLVTPVPNAHLYKRTP